MEKQYTLYQQYDNPLVSKYASKDMLYLLAPKNKYVTWRKLWLALAKAEQAAGLNITALQIKEMEQNLENIDFALVKQFEAETQHEVIAHIKAFAKACPLSAAVIHLGETSAFVIDNTDLIISKQALELLQAKLYRLLTVVTNFSDKYKALPTLAFTHMQVAQPTTVGKRASLWLNSLLFDFTELLHVLTNLKLRGVKGTTGTAASFKKLLNSNYSLLEQIDKFVAKEFGFKDSYKLTSQTYDRKVDIFIAEVLLQIAVSSHKITNDLRLLQHLREISEPFSNKQVGSSAMPYKRNPILSERIASLAKFVISLHSSTALVASTQWLERTLDDSANKRLVLPQMFLAMDAILELLIKTFSGIVVYEEVISSNLQRELPFLLTENILMEYVKKGGSRQQGHEQIRKHAMQAFNELQNGKSNKLLQYIAEDDFFKLTKAELDSLLNPKDLVGFATEQVDDFLKAEVVPVLQNFNYLNKGT